MLQKEKDSVHTIVHGTEETVFCRQKLGPAMKNIQTCVISQTKLSNFKQTFFLSTIFCFET